MKELFIEHRFTKATRTVLDQGIKILDEYMAKGFVLTLRQLFYQYVARKYLPNQQTAYAKVCRVIGDARNAGLVDWAAIEDRSRELNSVPYDASPTAAIEFAADTYRENFWLDQPYYPIVAIEKDALLGVIEDVCRHEFGVDHLSIHGSSSDTRLYDLGKKCADAIKRGKIPVVLLLTDHDPTGWDMRRDVKERLARYARKSVKVLVLGLTLRQARDQYDLPVNFAKETDPRYEAYVEEFDTTDCWELDALSPEVIVDLIRTALNELIDRRRWQAAERRQQRNRALIQAAARKLAKSAK
jgi:hypothetical protein